MEFCDLTCVLVFFTTRKVFDIVDTKLWSEEEWNDDIFESFRDGERIEINQAEDSIVILQTAAQRELLLQSKVFCEACKRKKFATSKIRTFLRPVRGVRR